MNLAILHYHLDPGGVTRVIENHLRAMDAAAAAARQVAVLHGGRTAGWPADLARRLSNTHVSLHVVPGLDYDDGSPASSPALAATIRETLAGLRFRQDDTVLHAHNHSLGKNVSMPAAITDLASDGWRLLLQIHDFAEDFRPANYLRLIEAFGTSCAATLYPQAEHIHYAVLNGRDHAHLAEAGVPSERLHTLPNPVPAPDGMVDRDAARARLERALKVEPDRRYVLYPVRGIRRKNLGEAVLLSLLDRRETLYGVALAPLNPAAKPFYERWRQFADAFHCPIRFGTGDVREGGLPFEEHVAAADAAVTTSVAEGFGMAFLEPWLAGLPLSGRDLPAITSDFRAAGVNFDRLYERLSVPIDWVGRDRFTEALRQAGDRLLIDYGRRPLPMHAWRSIVDHKTAAGTVDFGDLDETLQEAVLRRLVRSSASCSELRALNPQLEAVPDAAVVAANASSIRSAYSLESIGRQLVDLYGQLLSTPAAAVDHPVSGETLLSRFLDVSRFRLIRDR